MRLQGRRLGAPSTQFIISNLIDAFLKPDDRLQRIAAGRALGILTIMSTDNCWAILLADPELNLINNLISMLEDECSADILHNLCANSRDKLMDIDLRSSVLRESALPKVSIIGDNNCCIPPTLERWVYINPIHGPLDWPLYT